jgi:dTDP-4-amino-4,6-dideoxygalactose transaminase
MEQKKIEYPLGKGRYERPEIEMCKAKGYEINDPRDAIKIFEQKIAEFTGAKYAVAVDNLTDGLFLSLKLLNEQLRPVIIPNRTYCSVPMTIKHAGNKLFFEDLQWKGMYQLQPFPIWDCAVSFKKDMYKEGQLMVLSFQHKKRLCIGKGGMILTDNEEYYKWLVAARYEGRNLDVNQWDDEYSMIGWNMYMSPDDAARGILIFDDLIENNTNWEDWAGSENYPDLSTKKIFQRYVA